MKMLLTAILLFFAASSVSAEDGVLHHYQALIPILGTTMEDKEVVGAVAPIIVDVIVRSDEKGLTLRSRGTGKFSLMAKSAIANGIAITAKALGIPTESLTVELCAPKDVTIGGGSLSAMVAISVLMMASGHPIPNDFVVTGMVMPDGTIGAVGEVPLKVQAAYAAHIGRVLVPEENDPADGDWQTPFLMQVSPVGTVRDLYTILTEK